jgi:hypothetical protein
MWQKFSFHMEQTVGPGAASLNNSGSYNDVGGVGRSNNNANATIWSSGLCLLASRLNHKCCCTA